MNGPRRRLALLSRELDERPFGSYGDMVTRPAGPPPPPQPFVIPPPPWSVNYVPELDPDYEPPEPAADTETPA
jgi:hypothetical protein